VTARPRRRPWLLESVLNLYRIFCQPTSFGAQAKAMRIGERARFMVRMAPVMLLSAALTVGSLSLLLQLAGLPFHWSPKGAWWYPTLTSVVVGMACGTAWNVAMGVASGVIWGPAQWLIAGVLLPLLRHLPTGPAHAIALTVPVGLALGVGLGVAGGTPRANLVWGIAVGLGLGAAVGAAGRTAWAIGWLASFFAGYFRLEWYALDVEVTLWQLVWARYSPARARFLFHRSPIYWREPIWLPLLGLRAFLRLLGEHDYQVGVEECLFVISERPTQAWAARAALMEIMARRLAQVETVQQIVAAAEEVGRARARGVRLPEVLEGALSGFEELAGHAQQHLTATLPHNRRRAVERLRDGAEDLARRLALEGGGIASMLVGATRKWHEIARANLTSMGEAEAAAGFVHNPFVFGQPIEETETNLFVGRRDVVRQIEMSLLGGTAKPAVVLWGPRRMGKTSVLLQLSRLLGPTFFPAFVDMQAMQVRESIAAFFRSLTEAAGAALRRRGLPARRLELKDLADHPFNTFAEWLQEVEAALGPDRYLLLCLDEFERLETSIREGKLPAELMDQIRHIIQHHPRVVVLVSGSHRPDEMQLNWPDVLISTRLIEVTYLAEDEARQLVTRPVPDFAITYAPGSLEQIIRLTHCQPYLVQAVCFELVNHLNLAGRREAQQEDVAEAVQRALDSTRLYFAEMWRQLTERQRRLLRAISETAEGAALEELAGQAGPSRSEAESELKLLQGRSIVEIATGPAGDHGGVWRFQVPMVQEWVRTRTG
jgi:hypothetical protein